MKTAYLAASAILCAAPTFAQTDDCSTPTAINTTGTFAYDTSANTVSGVTPCGANFNTDAFWVWTAPADGDYEFTTCGTSYDTRIGVYSGTDCAATCVAENDDFCGLQSGVNVTGILTGDQFVIHVGGFGSTNTGPGVMNITSFVGCGQQADDAFEDNDDCASAVAMGDGQYTGLFVSDVDTDYYTVTVPDQGTLQVDIFFIDANGDTDIFLYADLATCQLDEGNGHGCANALVCGFSASDNEQIIWTNTTGSPQTYWMKVNEWVAATCNNYDMVISGTGAGGPTTSIACDPANNHTGGNYAKMDTSDASGPGAFHLECTDGPTGEFGYFLVSGFLNDPGTAVSNGMLCLGAPIGRFAPAAGGALNSIGSFDGAGQFQSLSGNSTVGSGYDVMATLPTPPGGTIAGGQTWHFQCWYRDGQRSNFSNVITVNF